MNGDYEENCRFGWDGHNEEELGCTSPAKFLIAWQPAAKTDDVALVSEIDTALVNQGAVEGKVAHDWSTVCLQHKDAEIERLKSYKFPEEAAYDFIYVGLLSSVTIVEREQTIPERSEELRYNVEPTNAPRRKTPTEKSQENPANPPEAPWGYRADGVTPRSKPGRKAAATRS